MIGMRTSGGPAAGVSIPGKDTELSMTVVIEWSYTPRTFLKEQVTLAREGYSIEIGDGRAFLIATLAKAVADKLHDVRGIGIQTQKEMSNYLERNLRVDPAVLRELKPAELDTIALRYQSRKIRLLSDLVRRIHHQVEKESSHA